MPSSYVPLPWTSFGVIFCSFFAITESSSPRKQNYKFSPGAFFISCPPTFLSPSACLVFLRACVRACVCVCVRACVRACVCACVCVILYVCVFCLVRAYVFFVAYMYKFVFLHFLIVLLWFTQLLFLFFPNPPTHPPPYVCGFLSGLLSSIFSLVPFLVSCHSANECGIYHPLLHWHSPQAKLPWPLQWELWRTCRSAKEGQVCQVLLSNVSRTANTVCTLRESSHLLFFHFTLTATNVLQLNAHFSKGRL